MKRNLFIIQIILVSVFFSAVSFGQTDSVIMGPGYADDVFYSMKNGEVSRAARDNWDIAFFTPRFSAGIIINEGNGVQLYTYPNGDTSAWSTIDTNGMSGWTLMNNSPEFWEDGAFNVNAKGHPDYGWGVYNQIDHSVYGDSIFIINTPSGLKKLMIIKKVSIDNIYSLAYADVDGANEQYLELDVKPMEDKRFAYFSLASGEMIDREPAMEEWDILFTKYMDWTTSLEGDSSLYLVTGVTNNVGVYSKNFYPVAPSFSDWYPGAFDSTKNAIGYEWKSFDMSTFQWTVKDSNYFFVNTFDKDIYKLKFMSWSGSGSGVCVFEKSLVSLSSVDEMQSSDEGFQMYPNPSSGFVTLKVQDALNGSFTVRVLDLSGRLLQSENFSGKELNGGLTLSGREIPSGIYIVSITGNNYNRTQKLIVR